MLARALLTLIGLLPSLVVGAEESARGVILRMSAGGAEDARVARGVALYVPGGAAVSPFLGKGPFKAVFEGKLVLEKRSRLIFHLVGTGKARLLLDGEVLVPAMGQPNESKRLKSGEHELVVEYEPPAGGDAQLRLHWEGRDFSREPVPASVLVHDANDPALVDKMTLRHGRLVLAEKRCTACHDAGGESAMPELQLKAPSLDGIGKRLHERWLIDWIANPKAVRPSAHMPVVFREDARKKAADVAAYFAAGVSGPEVPAKANPEEIKKGGHIFHEQGCIACHTLDARGDVERIGLGAVRNKFRAGALRDFLREPARFHQATRMPTFGFGEAEATALAAYLRSLGADSKAPFEQGDPERGHVLAAASGCFNCHEKKGEKSLMPAAPPFQKFTQLTCRAMSYSFASEEKVALESFLKDETAHASLGQSVPAEFAHRQYGRLRCNACHSRDGEESLREKYAAEVAHLTPPAPAANEEKPAIKTEPPPLNHLGLKLRPEWRTRLFAGKIDPKVRPWMPARMPAFPSRAGNLSAGFSHLAGMPARSPVLAAPDPDTVKVGSLVTSEQGGLACRTCHGIGDKPPIAVFEGEGPNLRVAGSRLTREYFHLWMNDPLRAWPGTIMPKYAADGKTGLTQYYDGDAAKQFDAIYEYLRSLTTN